MMDMQYKLDNDAIKKAWAVPTKDWFVSKQVARCRGKRPFPWSFFTNYRMVNITIGKPAVKYHGPEVPESKFIWTFGWWPFKFIVFWHRRCLCWIGS